MIKKSASYFYLSNPDIRETLIELKLVINFFFPSNNSALRLHFIFLRQMEKKIKHSKCLQTKLNYSYTIIPYVKIIYFLVFLRH